MPSVSYQAWSSARSARLDEIARAHRSVGGTGRGRRFATRQINHAYAVLLSAEFQGFCRDLHTESIGHLTRTVVPFSFRQVLQDEFHFNRKLDRGNPTPGNIGSDYTRLGISIWAAVDALNARNRQRRADLEQLNEWRNAIAHQDFDPSRLGGTVSLHLSVVRNWRAICSALAIDFDVALRDYIRGVVGSPPWA